MEWGEHTGTLSESFRVGRRDVREACRHARHADPSIVSPLLFVAIAAIVMFVVVALFLPLIDLISKLS